MWLAFGILLVLDHSLARAATSNACLARKLGDLGRAVAVEVGCYARDAAKSDAVGRAACLSRAARRFTGGDEPSRGQFAKRERRPPCLTIDDQSAMADSMAAYAAALRGAVGNPGTSSWCDAAKLRCLGRYLTGAFGCLARAAAGNGVVDAGCLATQAARLWGAGGGCLGKAVSRGSCSASGDGAALAVGAETFAAATLCALDPVGTPECAALPTPVPTPTRTATPVSTRTPTPIATSGSNDPAQLCVDTINAYRSSIGRVPLARWTAAETCVEDQGFADSQSATPHSAFGQCSEWAQNECPNWPGPPEQMIGTCLQMMWNEGPGEPYSQHGHYINMANPNYTKVACGFAVLLNGRVWAVQDFQ
jgi:hypothetical protein